MPKSALQALDIGFLFFHTALVLFNVLGWMWRSTRRWNLATLIVTAISWFVMGLWRGIGYCLCTDWHWQVRRALGYHDRAETYIQFLAEKLVHHDLPAHPIRVFSGAVFSICVIGSVATNLSDWRASRALTSKAFRQEPVDRTRI